MRVLITRAAEDAARSAAKLEAMGHEALVAPLRRRVLLPLTLPQGTFEGVIATSRHAFAVPLPASLRDLPCYCVGAATAQAARAAGFRQVVCGAGDGAALAGMLGARRPRPQPLLYLAGRPRHGALEAGLRAAGITVVAIEVYAMAREEALPEAVRAALAEGRVDAVLHYSAESARAFFALAGAAGLAAGVHLCLSPGVAQALPAGAPALVAARPDEAALLALLSQG